MQQLLVGQAVVVITQLVPVVVHQVKDMLGALGELALVAQLLVIHILMVAAVVLVPWV